MNLYFVKVVSLKDVGSVFYSIEDGMYNVYTRSEGYGDFCFQFGVSVDDTEDIVDLIWSNLENHNLFFEVD